LRDVTVASAVTRTTAPTGSARAGSGGRRPPTTTACTTRAVAGTASAASTTSLVRLKMSAVRGSKTTTTRNAVASTSHQASPRAREADHAAVRVRDGCRDGISGAGAYAVQSGGLAAQG
jgi:hypothetical protein